MLEDIISSGIVAADPFTGWVNLLIWGIAKLSVFMFSAFFLSLTRICMFANVLISDLQVTLTTKFLPGILKAIYNVLGISSDSVGGIFLLFCVVAVLLYGLQKIYSIFFPQTGPWVNLMNVAKGAFLLAFLFVGSFTLLSQLEDARGAFYSYTNDSITKTFDFFGDHAKSDNGVGGGNNADDLGLPLVNPDYISQNKFRFMFPLIAGENMQDVDNNCDAKPDSGGTAVNPIDGLENSNRCLAAGLSLNDVVGAYIGMSKPRELFDGDTGTTDSGGGGGGTSNGDPNDTSKLSFNWLGTIPAPFFKEYLSMSAPSNWQELTEFVGKLTNEAVSGSIHAFCGFLMGIVVLLEGIARLLLTLLGIAIFANIPVAILLSFFNKTASYWSRLTEKYIQLWMLTFVLAGLLPAVVLFAYYYLGMIGFLVLGFAVYPTAINLVKKPLTEALAMVVDGVTTSMGLGSITSDISSRGLSNLKFLAGLGLAAATGGATLTAFAGNALLNKKTESYDREIGQAALTGDNNRKRELQAEKAKWEKRGAGLSKFGKVAGNLTASQAGQFLKKTNMMNDAALSVANLTRQGGVKGIFNTLAYANKEDAFMTGLTKDDAALLKVTQDLREGAMQNMQEVASNSKNSVFSSVANEDLRFMQEKLKKPVEKNREITAASQVGQGLEKMNKENSSLLSLTNGRNESIYLKEGNGFVVDNKATDNLVVDYHNSLASNDVRGAQKNKQILTTAVGSTAANQILDPKNKEFVKDLGQELYQHPERRTEYLGPDGNLDFNSSGWKSFNSQHGNRYGKTVDEQVAVGVITKAMLSDIQQENSSQVVASIINADAPLGNETAVIQAGVCQGSLEASSKFYHIPNLLGSEEYCQNPDKKNKVDFSLEQIKEISPYLTPQEREVFNPDSSEYRQLITKAYQRKRKATKDGSLDDETIRELTRKVVIGTDEIISITAPHSTEGSLERKQIFQEVLVVAAETPNEVLVRRTGRETITAQAIQGLVKSRQALFEAEKEAKRIKDDLETKRLALPADSQQYFVDLKAVETNYKQGYISVVEYDDERNRLEKQFAADKALKDYLKLESGVQPKIDEIDSEISKLNKEINSVKRQRP